MRYIEVNINTHKHFHVGSLITTADVDYTFNKSMT